MNRDILILFEDLEFVETSPPMGGCFFWWVGRWMGGLVGPNMWNHKNFNKTWSNRDNWILFEDLWFVETHPPMGGCMGYCVGQWVWSCQITRNSIIQKLIKIIQFCLKVFVFCLHSHQIPATQTPTPLDYTQISNNSIGLESIKIIQFYLKIWILSRLLHSWVGEWFDGWVEGWSYVKSLIIK